MKKKLTRKTKNLASYLNFCYPTFNVPYLFCIFAVNMTLMKKLDRYVLGKFCLIFVAAFFICLFVLMMQFTWQHVDELVGKGLTVDILSQFFYYMALTLVPQALPLAVLLASLICFGNLGESFELIAMKSSGVSLWRVMMPMLGLSVLLSGVSFFFQNKTSPDSVLQLRTLLISMKQTSPAMEIPEGIFYNGVPNINIYVKKKVPKTGMLYDLIIYKTDQGFDKAQIVLADSGRIEMSADKMHLRLDIWEGEQYQSLQSGDAMSMKGANMPYDRETFGHKSLLIDFDANFNVMDADLMKNMPSTKNMVEIVESVDSMNHEIDSAANRSYKESLKTVYNEPEMTKEEAKKVQRQANELKLTFDKLTAQMSADNSVNVYQRAKTIVQQRITDLKFKEEVQDNTIKFIRRHWIEWHQKITMSLACILFFLIGAPLGAIIRKGGLGMPSVVAVIIFIIYYVINTSMMKQARQGSLNMVVGMWTSTAILLPLSIFLTYQANRDSVVFNIDAYRALFRRFFGLRDKRNLTLKEVIIEDPDYDNAVQRLEKLRDDCRSYNQEHRLKNMPSYVKVFFRTKPDRAVEGIKADMDNIVQDLANSKDGRIIHALNDLPLIYASAHVSPFYNQKWNKAAGIFLPVGIVLWVRVWIFRMRLHKDMKQIDAAAAKIIARIAESRKRSN